VCETPAPGCELGNEFMSFTINKLHDTFVGEVVDIDLRTIEDVATLKEIREAIDQYAVLVFREQRFDNEEHLTFAKRLDNELHAKTGSRTISKNRFGNEALTDISNIDATAEAASTASPAANSGKASAGDQKSCRSNALLKLDDRRRLYSLANRLWHTDASFEYPPGRYSMLYAYVVPDVSADTQFADMRTAYDELPVDMKKRINDYTVHHSIAYSRQTLGFEFSVEEAKILQGAMQPLVREFPQTGRKSLYLASHASSIEGLPLPEARLLIRDLIEHATRPEFVYSHAWRRNDLVIYDNRATMHRATPFDDQNHVRELRRVTTLDLPPPSRSRAFSSDRNA